MSRHKPLPSEEGARAPDAGNEPLRFRLSRLPGDRRRRVHKRRYLFYFFIVTMVLSIGQFSVGEARHRSFIVAERTSLRPVNEETAAEYGLSIEMVRAVEQHALGPLDWALAVTVGGYTVAFKYSIFINLLIGGMIGWSLYIRARDRAASEMIDEQNKELRNLNEELNRKFEETERYLKELRAAQSKLVQAEKLASLGRMAATLAHEIRNPMSIIKSSAQMVAEDLDPTTPQYEAVTLIRQEIKRLDHVINELLNFARPKPARVGPVSLNELVEAWTTRMREQLRGDGVEMKLELDPQLRPALADSDHLYQVFLNLVWNARDAIREKGSGTIVIRTEEAGPNGLYIIIEDNGKGMDAETLRNIYEPFFTTKTHGTGLGIPVVRQLLEAMGGTAHIDSEPGRGTTVHLHLSSTIAQFSTDSEFPLPISHDDIALTKG
jgi:signal transduction histidine kinase